VWRRAKARRCFYSYGLLNLKIAFHTLGCKLNQVETEAVAQMFAAKGCEVADEAEADLVFVNTCAVTGKAEAKSRKLLRRLAQAHPGRVIAAGCYAQAKTSELTKLGDFRLILGTGEKGEALKALAEPAGQKVYVAERPQGQFLTAAGYRFHSRAFIKIQDGCSHKCAYCIVPLLRGASVSLNADEVIRQVKKALADKPREIVLTGVDIGSYRQQDLDLAGLLEKLIALDEVVRIRLSSVEPMDFNDRLVEVCASSSKICPHFHIPLQSGSTEVLQGINRPYTSEEYLELTGELAELIPHVRIGADVVAGLPGEGETQFAETCALIEKSPLTHLHIFPFSPRPGTEFDAEADIIPYPVKVRRAQELQKLGAEKNLAFIAGQKGKIRQVFFEDCGEGFTDNYIRIKLDDDTVRGFHFVRIGGKLPAGKSVQGFLV